MESVGEGLMEEICGGFHAKHFRGFSPKIIGYNAGYKSVNWLMDYWLQDEMFMPSSCRTALLAQWWRHAIQLSVNWFRARRRERANQMFTFKVVNSSL